MFVLKSISASFIPPSKSVEINLKRIFALPLKNVLPNSYVLNTLMPLLVDTMKQPLS
jgi:hypothetical protein